VLTVAAATFGIYVHILPSGRVFLMFLGIVHIQLSPK